MDASSRRTYMREYMRRYYRENTEARRKDVERHIKRYNEDEAHREKCKAASLARYYAIKADPVKYKELQKKNRKKYLQQTYGEDYA